MTQNIDEHQGKVWVIGLDGATWSLIEPGARQGELPTFARLMREGAWGALHSPIPQSPPAWASFMTGCNPGKHGIYDWTQPQSGSYRIDLPCGASVRAPTLWQLLSQAGHTVGVVNVPMTYPPDKINGFLIAGFDTPYGSADFVHPPSLHEELLSRFGHYTIMPIIVGIPLRQTVQNFLATIDQREQVMHHLLGKYSPELFVLVFNATDSLQHLCFLSYDNHTPQMQALRTVYRKLDAVLASLVERLPHDTTLIVMSDHGSGPMQSYIHLDHWLARRGWLRYADDASIPASERWRARLAGGFLNLLKATVPRAIKERLRDQTRALRTNLEQAARPPSLDWSHTQACTFSSQGIYINLRGRQPRGTVEPGQAYETLLDRITKALLDLRDPTDGRPMVSRVYRKEELFVGPYLDTAPDLYVRWRDDAYVVWSNQNIPRTEILTRPRVLEMDDIVPDESAGARVGCHRQDGIVLFYGKRVRPGQHLEGAQLVDLAPTILALMGEPIPTAMDGRVLARAFLKEAVNTKVTDSFSRPQSEQEGYSEQEREQVKERLRELGYL